MTEPIAIARNSAEIVAALGKIREMRGLSNQFCDTRGGLTEGHTDKVLGPSHAKAISEMTLDTFMELFAVQFIVVPNPEAEDRMKAKWEGRDSSNVRLGTHRMSKELLARAKPLIFKEMAKLATVARKDIPREIRVKIARKAVVTRWRNERKKRREARMVPVVVAEVTA